MSHTHREIFRLVKLLSRMNTDFAASSTALALEDIQAVLFDVLRHRLILSFEAEAAGIDQDRVIQRILDRVAVG